MSKTTQTGHPSRSSRWEQALLIVGLLALNVWVWSMVRTALVQRRETHTFEAELKHLDDKPSPFSTHNGESAPPPEKNGLVGRLSIPRLSLHAIVREGDSAGTLAVALGHIPGTALPGQRGNVGVAGHRDTLFRALEGIRRNDTITFETLGGTYEYQVDGIQIVKPTDVAVLNSGAQPELTLVTCYPFSYVGHAPKRYIVKAKMVLMSADTKKAAQLQTNHTGNLVAISNE